MPYEVAPYTHSPPSPTKKPRASFSVTMLDDMDFVALRHKGAVGDRAISVYFTLVLLAKKLRNGGTFTQPVELIASMIFTTAKEVEAAIKLITEVCSRNGTPAWLVRNKKKNLVVRSFTKWNDEKRGGVRPRAGRPRKHHKDTESNPNKTTIKEESNGNQIDFKVKSNTVGPVSVSVPVSELNQQQQIHPGLPAQAQPPNPPIAAAAAGAFATSEQRQTYQALLTARIADPPASELARCDRLTPAIVEQEAAKASAGGKGIGVLVLNLRQIAAAANGRPKPAPMTRDEQEALFDRVMELNPQLRGYPRGATPVRQAMAALTRKPLEAALNHD